MKLSITIATYNVQNYIVECMDSILNQTFKDFEVICIDDGSKDNTVSILKEYASNDHRICLIEKEKNEGLAVARNLSLELARGQYITFLDGDDYYDLTLFEKAIEIADNTQADLVIWDYVTFYQPNEIEKLKYHPSDLINFNTSNKNDLLKRPSFTWVKLLRTEKARSLGIVFPKGYTRQDIPVHWHLITKLDKIEVLPERLAYYRQQNEATTAKKDEKLLHLALIMDIVEKYLRKEQIFESYKQQFYKQQLDFFYGMYDNIKKEFKEEALIMIKVRLKKEHIQYLKSNNLVRPQTKYFLLGINGNHFYTFILSIWKFTRIIYRLLKRI